VEEDDFSAAYRAHGTDVWRFARRRCRSAESADDVAAEVFATAWRRRDDLPASSAEVRLWLLGTARRVLANQRRSAQRRIGLASRLTVVRPDPGPADPGEVVGDPDPLWAALASLPDDQRDLLVMRAWDELAVTDIAVLLGCTPNAASIRLTRARAALATALADADPKDRTEVRTSSVRDPDDGGGTDDRS
jgi:RNA polymerase sigma-70 factor (ECF subfamily)